MSVVHPNPSAIAALLSFDGTLGLVTGDGNALGGTVSYVSPSGVWGQAATEYASQLTSSITTAYDLNSTDFTIEARVRFPDAYSSVQVAIINSGMSWEYGIDLPSDGSIYPAHLASYGTSTIGTSQGVWIHVALVRYGNLIRLYVDGAIGWSTTSSARATSGQKALGIMLDGAEIDQVCVTRSALYTTTSFTPPSGPYILAPPSLSLNASESPDIFASNITGVGPINVAHPAPGDILALANFDGTLNTDAGVFSAFTKVDAWATPAYITGSGIFGQAASWQPGNGAASNYFSALDITNSDFTIEARLGCLTDSTLAVAKVSLGNESTTLQPLTGIPVDGWYFGLSAETTNTSQRMWQIFAHDYFNSSEFVYTTPIVAGEPVHLAISRQGSILRMFVNGTLVQTSTWTGGGGSPRGAADLRIIGRETGFVDWLCLTKSCIYTTSFTPPTGAFNLPSEQLDTFDGQVVLTTTPPLCPDVAALYTWTATATAGITVNNGSGSPTVSITAMSQSVDTGEVTMIGTRTGYPTITWTFSVLKTRLLMPSGTIASTIPPINLFAASVSGGTATAQVRFNTDGSIELNSGAGFYSFGKWFNPIGGTPGLNYEIFLNGTWNSLSSPVTYSVSATGVGNVLSGTILIAANGARSNILGSVNLYLYAYGTP